MVTPGSDSGMHFDHQTVGSAGASVEVEISLLGSFGLRVAGTPIEAVTASAQRILVFLALLDRPVGREAMAGTIWPDASIANAGVSLRTALSRLDAPTREAILSVSGGLLLAETVFVDLRAAQRIAHRLLDSAETTTEDDLTPAAVAALSLELLPDWYDEWVVAAAEDWRQLRMTALEEQARRLTQTGRFAEAATAARAAMRVAPLRESAHSALIQVHLAEGNQSEALRVFDRYRSLLGGALDLEPTPLLADLVAGLRRPRNTAE